MSFLLVSQAIVSVDGVQRINASLPLADSEVVLFDEELEVDQADQVITLGVADTAKLKSLALTNSGTFPVTLKVDSGTLEVTLGAGETLLLAGATVAKSVVDALADATTLLVLKATTGSGPARAHLKVVALVDGSA